MIHGECSRSRPTRPTTPPAKLAALTAAGLEVEQLGGGEVEFVVPLGVAAFFNPELVPDLGLGPVSRGSPASPSTANDEQIDNALRSLLFQVPGPGAQGGDRPRRARRPARPRPRHRGYNALAAPSAWPRAGPSPRSPASALTASRPIRRFDPADPIDDPDVLDFTALFDAGGKPLAPVPTRHRRRPLRPSAARPSRPGCGRSTTTSTASTPSSAWSPSRACRGSELGRCWPIWRRQFEALRDGDRSSISTIRPWSGSASATGSRIATRWRN